MIGNGMVLFNNFQFKAGSAGTERTIGATEYLPGGATVSALNVAGVSRVHMVLRVGAVTGTPVLSFKQTDVVAGTPVDIADFVDVTLEANKTYLVTLDTQYMDSGYTFLVGRITGGASTVISADYLLEQPRMPVAQDATTVGVTLTAQSTWIR